MLMPLKFKDQTAHPPTGRTPMPHDHIQLAQAPNGELGPRCHNCGMRLTFGNAKVVNQFYMCWEHYVEATGADTATVISDADERFWMKQE